MPSKDPLNESFWIFSLSFIGSPSSELFLALSGTVLLPIKTGIRKFYYRRFKKILPPLIFWSVLGIISYIPVKNLSYQETMISILKIPLQPIIGVYWFLYVMAGLYLFAPVISSYLENINKRRTELFLVLWILTLLMPWLYEIFSADFNQSGSHYWMLNYFGGFLGYWVLGFYLTHWPIRIGCNKKWIILCSLVISYPLLILLMKKFDLEVGPFMDNLQFGSAVLVTFLYTIFQNIKLPLKSQLILTRFSKYCFGIYLIHYFVKDFYWNIFEDSTIHIFPRTIIIALITMLSCGLFLWLLSKIPYGKHIVGI